MFNSLDTLVLVYSVTTWHTGKQVMKTVTDVAPPQSEVSAEHGGHSSDGGINEVEQLRRQLEAAKWHIQQGAMHLAAAEDEAARAKRQADVALQDRDTRVAEASHQAAVARQREEHTALELEQVQRRLQDAAKEREVLEFLQATTADPRAWAYTPTGEPPAGGFTGAHRSDAHRVRSARSACRSCAQRH